MADSIRWRTDVFTCHWFIYWLNLYKIVYKMILLPLQLNSCISIALLHWWNCFYEEHCTFLAACVAQLANIIFVQNCVIEYFKLYVKALVLVTKSHLVWFFVVERSVTDRSVLLYVCFLLDFFRVAYVDFFTMLIDTDSELWYFLYCIYVCVYLFLYLNIDFCVHLLRVCDVVLSWTIGLWSFYIPFFYTVNTKLGLRYSVIFIKTVLHFFWAAALLSIVPLTKHSLFTKTLLLYECKSRHKDTY